MLASYRHHLRLIRREAWIVLLGAVAQGFTWQGLSDAIVSLFLVRIGFGPEFVGASAAVANLGYALASMPSAVLSRRIGARRGMILGSVAWAGGLVLLSFADLLPPSLLELWIIAWRLVAAGGLALYAVSSQPYLTAVTSEVERPLAFALVISLRPLGGFFGSMLGGFLPGLLVRAIGETSLNSVTQPRAYGLTLALGAVIYAPVIWSLWTLPRDGPSEQPQGVSPQADTVPEAPALSQPAWARLAALSRGAPLGILVSIAVVCFLRVGGEFTARTFFSVYADARWAIPTAQIGGIIALSSLLTIPAPLVTPALVARYGRVKMITAGAAGTAASIALLGVGANWGLASLAFVGISVLGAAARSVWSLVIQESVDEVWRPASAAVANLFSGLGTMAMSSAGGVLAAGVGYRATFLSSAALVAAGAVTVWFAFRQVVD